MNISKILRSVLTAVLTLVATTASALVFEVEHIRYVTNGDGTVEVIRNSYNYSGSVLIPKSVKYSGTTYSVTSIGSSAFQGCSGLKYVTIPESVTSIGDGAFSGCGLTYVTIPESVTSIGGYAFYGCSLTYVIIPDSVTSIGESAFQGCSDLTSVYIGNSVTSIGGRAFSGCGLTRVTIGNSVTSIGGRAFSGCSGLTSVTIPESVTSIGDEAFARCSGLTSVTIPESVTSIGSSAFEDCSGLTSVTIPESVTSIGVSVFCGCSGLTSVTIGNSVTSIGYSAFEDCYNLTSVTIPNSVTSIGAMAFLDCSGLTSVTIPNSVTSIGSSAFKGCGLTSVTIPNSVTSIGGSAFQECSGLTSVTIPNSVTSISDSTFYNCSGLTSVTIPNSVTSIGDYAFGGCSGLTSVTIPESVTSIGEYAFSNCSGLTSVTIGNSVTSIGSSAFSGCSGLTSVTIPNSVTSISDSTFYNCSGLTSVTIPNSVTSIGDRAFYGCSGLTRVDISSIEAWLGIKFADYDSNPLNYAHHLYLNGEEVKDLLIPNSVTSISDYAFGGCSGLTSVTIPNSVTSIGDRAFQKCSGLTSVTIPNSVTSIGGSAFQKCSGLTSVTIPNSVTSISDSTFYNCSGLTSVTIGNSVTSIRGSAFYGCSRLTSVTIPNSVISIGYAAFWNCSGLTSVTIPNSVTSIGGSAFRDCSGLTSVTIPNSVTSISGSAFRGCSGLTSVTIPDSVTSIVDGVFQECSGLTSVTIPNSVTSIRVSAFEDCSGLKTITIPNSVTSIGWAAFRGCSGLTSVTIPNSVTSIGSSAFSGCSGLTRVTIPDSVTSIGSSAFQDCSGLTRVTIGNSVTSIGKSAFWGCRGLKNIVYNAENCADVTYNYRVFEYGTNIIIGKDVKKVPNYLFYGLDNAPTNVVSISVTPPTCGANTFNSKAYTATLHVPSTSIDDYMAADVWMHFATIEPNDAENAADLIEGTYKVNFGLQGVKMHGGVLYACTTAESVNKSTPTLHGNNAVNMDTYEDRNFADFDQRDWVAISGLEGDFEGKELSYPFVAQFSDGVLTPSGTITATADSTAYALNTFRAENILHGGYSNYTESDYKAYYVPARVNEVAKFMGFIETVGGVKYLYSDNAYGRKDGEGIKVEGNIADNSKSYSLLEGILVADASTKAGVKIIMLQDLGVATTTPTLSFTVGGIKYITNGAGTVEVINIFHNCYRGAVVIPNSVTYSGRTYSVTSIGDSAFYGCIELTSVSIPNSVTSIGYEPFRACRGLTRVDISSIEAWLGIKFADYDSNPLVYAHHLYLNGKEVKDLVIPNSVTSIGDNAFGGCSGLTSVTIPNSVTSIGEFAFNNCSGLTSVTIPNSVTSIGEYAFGCCSGLTSVTIPESVTSIGKGAFVECHVLTSVTIPDSVTSIGDCVFWDCYNLTSVTIPNSVTSIGYGAFFFCSGLTSVTIGDSVTSIGKDAFAGCSGLTSVTIPESVTSIGGGAFRNCRGLTRVTIGNSVTSIGYHAFSDCRGLTSVTIPNSVTSIGGGAFWNCRGLTSVTIPNSVTSIGDNAFLECSGLTSVTIPDSVTSIGDRAFSGCSGLETIFYNAEKCADVTDNDRVFEYGTNIIIGKDVKKVPNYLFYGLYNAPTSVISKSVTPPTCGANTFNSKAYTATLYVPSTYYMAADVWKNFTTIEIETNDAENVTDLIEGPYKVNFGLQGVKMHGGVLYACTTAESVNKSTPTLHDNNAVNMDTYEDRNFAEFDQRDWVAISGLEGDFEGKELSYPFVAQFSDGVLTPSGTITATTDATAYALNTFRAENILHGGYSNYTESDYKAYYVPARVNEVAKFMGFIETVGGVKYLYSDNAYGRKDGEGIKVEGNIADNSKSYSLLEGILVADASTKAGVKIIMLQDLTTIEIEPNDAENVADLIEGNNKVNFGLQGVKMHGGVLYACTTAESVNKSTPTLHGNNAVNMDTYEDRNFADFDQRDWVAISGLEGDFEGKELSYPFVAQFSDGVLTPSGTITATADATAYALNTFRAENILHGGYSNYTESDYKAYYVPARVNEVAKFMGFIETVGGVKYLYSDNAYGRKDGEGIKVEGNIADNSTSYSLLEGILVADASTQAGVKIIMLQDLGVTTNVEGVATAARIYTANGNIIIAATEDGEAAVYDFIGRLIKSVPVASGDSIAVPVTPGSYIVKTGTKTQSLIVK